jgi:hypothetical protein
MTADPTCRVAEGEEHMAAPPFAPGFRLSAVDAVVLILGALVSAALASIDRSYCLVVCIPLAHFFVFCNVFRVSRFPELIWAGIFMALAGTALVSGFPGWWVTVFVAVCVCAVVVVAEMRKASYHGIFWQRINPRLPDWWEANAE